MKHTDPHHTENHRMPELAALTFEALSEGIADFQTMVRRAPRRRWGTTNARIFGTSGEHLDLTAVVPIDDPKAIVDAVRAVTVARNALAVAWATPATFSDDERLMVFVELPDGVELRCSATRAAGQIGRFDRWLERPFDEDSWISLPVNLPAWAASTEGAEVPVDGAVLQAIATRDYHTELDHALGVSAERTALIEAMEFEHPFRLHRDDRRCRKCRKYGLHVIRTLWPEGPGIQFRLSGEVGVDGGVDWRFDMIQLPMVSCPQDDKSEIPMTEEFQCLACGACYSRDAKGRLVLASARGAA